MLDLLNKVTSAQLKLAYHAQLKELLGHIDLVRRLERAYEMLVRDSNYEISVNRTKPVSFTVVSPNDTYIVTPLLKQCTCPDYEGGIKLCKHRLAIQLLINASKISIMNGEWYLKGSGNEASLQLTGKVS